jgi:hypothetical protein
MRVNSFDLLCNVAYKSRLRCWLTEERHTCWLGFFSEQEKPRSVLSSSILWLFLCQISFRLEMHCMIYSVQDAESKCSLVNGNVCWVPLSWSKSKWVLISAPDKKQVLNPEYICDFLMNKYNVSTRTTSLSCSCLKFSLLGGVSNHRFLHNRM